MKTKKSFIRTLLMTLSIAALLIPSIALAADDQVINYQIAVYKDANDANTIKKKVYVNMYKVKVVDNEYVGKRVKTLSTGKDGYQAVFKIKPGQVVDFVAFSKKSKAKSFKNKTHKFFSPPHKNFSEAGGPTELCYTAGIDFDNKLVKDETTGETFCAQAENGYLQGGIELSK